MALAMSRPCTSGRQGVPSEVMAICMEDGFDDLDEGPGGPVVVSLMRGCVGEWREVFGDEAQLFGMAVADCQG